MYNARPPAQLSLEGGPLSDAEVWRQWYSQFTMFLKSSGLNRGGSDVKASILLELIGPKGYDIYSTFMFERDGDSEDFEKLVKKFDEYFVTKQDCTVVRYNFFTRNQEKGESIDDYVTALRLLAQQCQFVHLEVELIKDRIVCGVTDEALRDTLLGTEDLTLEKAVRICQANKSLSEDKQEKKASGPNNSEAALNMDTYDSHRGRKRTVRELRRRLSA